NNPHTTHPSTTPRISITLATVPDPSPSFTHRFTSSGSARHSSPSTHHPPCRPTPKPPARPPATAPREAENMTRVDKTKPTRPSRKVPSIGSENASRPL